MYRILKIYAYNMKYMYIKYEIKKFVQCRHQQVSRQ